MKKRHEADYMQRDPAITRKLESILNRDLKSFLPMIRTSFLTGIFVVIPIFLSIWIAMSLFTRLTDWAVSWGKVAPFSGMLPPFWSNMLIRLFSLIFLFLAIIVCK